MVHSKEPLWLEYRVIRAVQARQIEQFGGLDGIKDDELIHSALARPRQLHHYGEPLPDQFALAASYAFDFVKNHAFLDGNKRIAHMAYRLFLAKNGFICAATLEVKYKMMIGLAASDVSEPEFAEWLRNVCSEA